MGLRDVSFNLSRFQQIFLEEVVDAPLKTAPPIPLGFGGKKEYIDFIKSHLESINLLVKDAKRKYITKQESTKIANENIKKIEKQLSDLSGRSDAMQERSELRNELANAKQNLKREENRCDKTIVFFPKWSTAYAKLLQRKEMQSIENENPEIARLLFNVREMVKQVEEDCSKKRKTLRADISPHSTDKVAQAACDTGVRLLVATTTFFEHMDEKIQEKKRRIDTLTGDTQMTDFANTFSGYVVSYLEEHLLHIKERDPELRPAFLENFFHRLYRDDPTPNWEGRLLMSMVSHHKEKLQQAIELNVLFFLGNVYEKVDATFSAHPYALMSLVHTTLERTLQEVREQTDPSLGTVMGVKERNLLLDGQMQERFSNFFLEIGFPNREEDLQLPIRGADEDWSQRNFFVRQFLKIRAGAEHKIVEANRKKIVTLVQDVITSLFRSSMFELSEHADIEQALFLKGYQELNAFLFPSSAERDISVKRGGTEIPVIDFLIALLTSFFQDLGALFIRRKSEQEDTTHYDKQDDLVLRIEESIRAFIPDTWLGKKIKNRFASTMAKKLAPQLAEKLKEFGGMNCINQALQFTKEQLDVKTRPMSEMFPRTQNEIEALQKKQADLREQREKEIQEEERRLQTRMPELAKRVVDFIGFDTTIPPEWDSMSRRAQLAKQVSFFFKRLINNFLKTLIRFVFWAIGLGPKIGRVSKAIRQRTQAIPQDAFALFMCDLVQKASRGGVDEHT